MVAFILGSQLSDGLEVETVQCRCKQPELSYSSFVVPPSSACFDFIISDTDYGGQAVLVLEHFFDQHLSQRLLSV
jgi:hypothetical protein